MHLFLLPAGDGRHALYGEQAADTFTQDAGRARGPRRWLRQGFAYMLRLSDASEDSETVLSEHSGTAPGPVQRRVVGWVADRLLLQLPLWSLREPTAVELVHPSDMTFAEARRALDGLLEEERRRHRLWLVVFAVALILSGAVAIVPGPNLIAYYFAFRVVGHWLSLQGATRGLTRVAWSGRPSESLRELRALVETGGDRWADEVGAIGRALELRRLPAFLAKVRR